jgi:hypothetical protein
MVWELRNRGRSKLMDVDIDFPDRLDLLQKLPHRVAKLESGKKHNTGVYFTEVPHDPRDNLATIDHKAADERGYFKIDCLNVSVYNDVKSEAHLIKLMEEPIWELLEKEEVTSKLFHVNGYHELLQKLKPRNLEQLAAVLAIIRPAKRYLTDKPWDVILNEVWLKPTTNEYYFKKAHSFSYAMAVVVHLNLFCENTLEENNE